MAFKHISLLWSAKRVIMGHMGDTAFLVHRQNAHITHITTFKCMINRLWYGNFHIIPHINPRPILALGLSAFGLIWVSRVDMGYENYQIIISIYGPLLHVPRIILLLWNLSALLTKQQIILQTACTLFHPVSSIFRFWEIHYIPL